MTTKQQTLDDTGVIDTENAENAEQPELDALVAEGPALPALTVPPPLGPAATLDAGDASHGVVAYPGYKIAWIYNDPACIDAARQQGWRSFTGDLGYVVNAAEYERDAQGHLLCAGEIAMVMPEAEYAERIAKKNAAFQQSREKAGRRKYRQAGVDDNDSVELEEEITSESRRVRVGPTEEDGTELQGWQNTDLQGRAVNR